MCVPNHSRRKAKLKLENRVKDSPDKLIDNYALSERIQKKVKGTNSDKIKHRLYGDVKFLGPSQVNSKNQKCYSVLLLSKNISKAT